MSQIATALAKAKERPHTQAPFMTGAAAASAVKKRTSANVIWVILLGLTATTAGGIYWLSQEADKPLAASSAPVQPAAAPLAPISRNTTATGGVLATPNSTVTTPQITPAALTARLARNESAIRLLSISAVMPGEQPRIMANGKVYHVGDIILPPEIMFAGTENGQLVFTDTSGNRFTRRF